MALLCNPTYSWLRIFSGMLFLLAGALLNGCATTDESRLANSKLTVPVKLIVMSASMKIAAGRLQKVVAPEVKNKLSASDEPISRAVTHSQQFSINTMSNDLANHADIISLIEPPPALPIFGKIESAIMAKNDTAHDAANDSNDKIPLLPQDLADQLHVMTGADAILYYAITDYGLTPQTWRTGYISFEVTSTLAIAALIASAGTTLAKGAAGAYLAQETVEETAESYAGFWALDKVCRPVRIEAELIQLNPVTVVWKGSDTGLSDVHLSRLTEKVDERERYNQLDQATDESVKEVVTALVKDLKNINSVPDMNLSRNTP